MLKKDHTFIQLVTVIVMDLELIQGSHDVT